MAKKPASPKQKKESESEQPQASTTQFTPKKTLNDLLKAARTLKSNHDDLTTVYAAQVREASDKRHLHTKAYNTIKMLDRLTPEKLADFMEHFDYYFEASGLEARAASAPRLDGVGGVQKDGGDDFEEDPPKSPKETNGGVGFPASSQPH